MVSNVPFKFNSLTATRRRLLRGGGYSRRGVCQGWTVAGDAKDSSDDDSDGGDSDDGDSDDDSDASAEKVKRKEKSGGGGSKKKDKKRKRGEEEKREKKSSSKSDKAKAGGCVHSFSFHLARLERRACAFLLH